MRLAYLVTDPSIRLDVPSGPSTHINGTLKGFTQNGVKARAFLARDYLPAPPTVKTEAEKRGLPIALKTNNPVRLLGRDLKWFLRSLALDSRLEEDLLAFAPDVIFERSWLFSLGGLRFAAQHSIPLFLETSGCAAEITSDTYGISSITLANLIERYKLNRANLAVVESRASVEWVKKKYRLQRKIVAKPLGFDAPTTSIKNDLISVAAKEFADLHETVVGFVGTFQSYQGTDVLLRAIKQLNSESESIGFILIGGRGNYEECVAYARTHNLQHVHFTGLVPQDTVASYLSLCSFAVVPDCEPHMSPIKTLQYGACRLPPIVPDYACFDGLIDDYREGRRFKAKSAHSLAKTIRELSESPSCVTAMGARVYNRISSEYSWKQVVSEVVEHTRAAAEENALRERPMR